MSIFNRKRNKRSSVAFLVDDSAYKMLCGSGYTSLDKNPEVVTCCRHIAQLISSMTIYLMANTEKGDQRIVNELSRKIDIYPNRYMTRKNWMESIVMNLLLYGNGNSVAIPLTKNGLLDDIVIQPPLTVSFIPDGGYGYEINVGGKAYNPDEVLHFVYNPDKDQPWKGLGVTASLKDVANNLRQAGETEKNFLESKWQPSVIVKVDGIIDEFSNPEGRKKLLDDYIASTNASEPWLIPAEQFSIEQVKPLTLNDLAIKDTVELNKKTVASILGVPAFLLGIGTFNKDEWNNFINTTVRSIAQIIEQELTRKLLLSPKWYFKFNNASLYAYDLQTTAAVYKDLRAIGVVTGNEVRDKLGMSPKEDLDELVMLENYIPASRLGDQNKLSEGEE